MKLRLFTGLSLAVNVLLFVLIWSGRSASSGPMPAVVEPTDPSTPKPSMSVRRTNVPAPAVESPAPPAWPPFRWDEIADRDYTNYLSNLRRIGCPEQTAGDVIRGATWLDLLHLAHARSIEMQGLFYRFLASDQGLEKQAEEFMVPIKAAEKARRELLVALGIPERRELPDTSEIQRRRQVDRDFSYVDPARRELVLAVENDWRGKRAVAETDRRQGKTNGPSDETLKAQRRTALLEVMDPDQQAEFKHREWTQTHGTEFQTLATITQSPEELQSLAGLSQSELVTRLGPARFAEMRGISDVLPPVAPKPGEPPPAPSDPVYAVRGDFRQLSAVAQRFNLPPSVPRDALDAIRSYEAPLKTVREDPDLLPRTRRQVVQGLEAERDRRVEGILGREAWETYRFHYGQW